MQVKIILNQFADDSGIDGFSIHRFRFTVEDPHFFRHHRLAVPHDPEFEYAAPVPVYMMKRPAQSK